MRLLEDGGCGCGYLLKDRVADLAQFADAVRRVATGGSVVDPQVIAALVDRPAEDDGELAELTRESARSSGSWRRAARTPGSASASCSAGARSKATSERSFTNWGSPPATTATVACLRYSRICARADGTSRRVPRNLRAGSVVAAQRGREDEAMSANCESDAPVGRPARSIDEFFERLYRRYGPRYVDLFKVFVWAAMCLFVVPAAVALLTAPWEPTLGEFLRCLVAYELPLALIAGPGTFVIARRAAPATFSWIGGRKTPADAPAAWRSTASGLPRWVGITTLWWAVWCVPPSIYTAATLHFEWYGYAIYFVALASLNSVVTVFFYLLFEQALRPVVREIAARLPAGHEPRSVMTLSVKALVLIPAINFFSAVVVGLTMKGELAPELYLGQIVLLALAVSLTLSLVLTLMFRNSVLRRIEDLRDAMRRVDRGELDTHVARLAGDELDDMGTSFNEMVCGLREREALRDHNAQLVVDLQRQARELQSSRARIVAASDAARRQVERDLHDGAQQGLLLLRLKLEMAALEARQASSAATATFDSLRSELDGALADLRDLAHGIYPTILELDGLSAALAEAARRAPTPTQLDCVGIDRYPTELEAAVYFCCVEALQNTAKHAGKGARAQITLTQRDDVLRVEVSDDGCGFASGATPSSGGLQNMIDRIGALGGVLQVQSAPGAGTKVRATIALTRALDAAAVRADPARL